VLLPRYHESPSSVLSLKPNPQLPQFPVGTMVALARHMMLIDDHAFIMPAPVSENIQVRVYL
jgi:hypothetical protein